MAKPDLATIRARVMTARASTDPQVMALAGDLDYLLSRLTGAEAAATAGEAYADKAAPFLTESFTRVVLAEVARNFEEASIRWRETL